MGLGTSVYDLIVTVQGFHGVGYKVGGNIYYSEVQLHNTNFKTVSECKPRALAQGQTKNVQCGSV